MLQDLTDEAKAGNCLALEKILKKFPSQVDYIHRGVTALQQASYYGRIEAMKTLIRHDADLDLPDAINYWTPLHYAVEGNQPMAVNLLLGSKADVSEKNIKGLTPPQVAYSKKLKECLREFISFHPYIDFKVPVEEREVPAVTDVQSRSSIPLTEPSAADARDNKQLQKVDDADRCLYCRKNKGIITFRPCDHEYACIECSVTQQVCLCGVPIEDRSIAGGKKVRSYIQDIKDSQTKLRESQRKVENMTKEVEDSKNKLKEAKGMTKCGICYHNPIECSLYCGHTYCFKCVRKLTLNGMPPHECPPPFKCAYCKRASRYTRLFLPWGDPDHKHEKQHSQF